MEWASDLERAVMAGMLFFGSLGLLCKWLGVRCTQRLLREAAKMESSAYPFFKRVRLKYDKAILARRRVENVSVFVRRCLGEYRVLWFPLEQYFRLKWFFLSLCGGTGLVASFFFVGTDGYLEQAWRIAMTAVAECVGLFVLFQLTDEKNRWEKICICMVDYLENVYAHRRAKECRGWMKQADEEKENKAERKQGQKEAVQGETFFSERKQEESADRKIAETKQTSQEELLRKILGEYLDTVL